MISVIIPTLNEAERLPETLAHIRRNDAPHEIVVVDAASADSTTEIAEAARCRVLRGAEPDRAGQMNLGAKHAQGETLFFLHADTLIAQHGLKQIEAALANPRVVGGGFRRRYRNALVFLRLTCALSDVRCRWLGWYLGDQGIFVRLSVFDQLGGFREMPVFEDLDLCCRLKRAGKLVCLGPPVLSSARRFASRGAVSTSMFDAWLTLRYFAGASPERLASSYAARIKQRNRKSSERSYA